MNTCLEDKHFHLVVEDLRLARGSRGECRRPRKFWRARLYLLSVALDCGDLFVVLSCGLLPLVDGAYLRGCTASANDILDNCKQQS
jgi:hypothetical protein